MQLIPAIDLREGRVVRLRLGDDGERTVYHRDPVDVLTGARDAGIERVHVVDLDAAFGEAPQRALLERIAAGGSGLELQLGGGLRDREAVEWALGAGFARAVITSLLVREPELFGELAEAFPRRLIAALDVGRDDRGDHREVLRHGGWRESAEEPLEVWCDRLASLPIAEILVTDITRDGAMTGPNLGLAVRLARACGHPSLLSGGVRGPDDLVAATAYSEIAGAVVGKALYDGAMTLEQGLDACRGRLVEERPS